MTQARRKRLIEVAFPLERRAVGQPRRAGSFRFRKLY